MEESMIYVQLIIGLTTLIYVFRQNQILKTQIRGQNDIIRNMEAYSRLIDLEKVQQYVTLREQTITDESRISLKELEAKYKEVNTDREEFETMTKEQAQLILDLLVTVYEHRDRVNLVKTHLPASKRVFIEILEKYKNVKPTAFAFSNIVFGQTDDKK